MASFQYPESCAYTPSDLTIFKMKVVEDMAALSDKKAVLAFLLERCGEAWTGLFLGTAFLALEHHVKLVACLFVFKDKCWEPQSRVLQSCRSRTVETVVAGSLRSNLYDLYEAQNWGFATEKVGTPIKSGIVTNALYAIISFFVLLLRQCATVHPHSKAVSPVIADALNDCFLEDNRAARSGIASPA